MLAKIVRQIVRQIVHDGMHAAIIAEVDFSKIGVSGRVKNVVVDRFRVGIFPIVMPRPEVLVERHDALANLLKPLENIFLREMTDFRNDFRE